jgi:hypothetical protein
LNTFFIFGLKMPKREPTATGLGAVTTNTILGMAPSAKVKYPPPSTRKKRFAKIRKQIEGNK